MAGLRLETLWSTRLRVLGWSPRASLQTVHSLANTTLHSYSTYIEKYVEFCKMHNIEFDCDNHFSVLADFLCNIADNSDRPESILRVVSAAISALFEALGKTSPMVNSDIRRLISGLVKTQTTKPMSRTKPMPMQPFIELFTKWGNNDQLSIKNLRLKAITLLALTCMTRPSDLAPRGKTFDKDENTFTNIILSTNNLNFMEDGSLTIRFFGIKNDTSRSGFEVNIPPNSNLTMDPVSCLHMYIDKTASKRPQNGALFIALHAPYKAISSETIGNILEEAIKLCGLGDKGFSAKSFRPTGATLAMATGILPETAMQLGRWKTKDTFMNHYVYPKLPEDFTSKLLNQ